MKKTGRKYTLFIILTIIFANSIFFKINGMKSNINKKEETLKILNFTNKPLKMIDKKITKNFGFNPSFLNNMSIKNLQEYAKNKIKYQKTFIEIEKNTSLISLNKLKIKIQNLKKIVSKSENNNKNLKNFEDLRKYKLNQEILIEKIFTCNLAHRVLMKATNQIKGLFKKEKSSSKESSTIIDVAIFLHCRDADIKKSEYIPDIILCEFINAINQGVRVIIATAPLAKAIFDFYNTFEDKKNKLENSTSIHKAYLKEANFKLKNRISNGLLKLFITNKHSNNNSDAKEEFAVIISTKKDETINLNQLGLNPNYLKPVKAEEISNKLCTELPRETNFVEQIKNIFYTSKNNISNLPGKIIYLTGHGSSAKKLNGVKNEDLLLDGSYAGIKHTDFLNLINFLDKINNLYLSISTCYAGGWNGLKIIDNSVSFPIMVNSISDNCCSSSTSINFKPFYKNIKNLFSNKTPFSQWSQEEKFKESLKGMVGTNLKNLPSICFPGDISFKTIDIHGNAQIIGSNEQGTIEIGNKRAILLYENIVNAKLSGNIPVLVSMIPGKAHHYLREINTNLKFDALIRNIIGNFRVVSPKMFFIGKVFCQSFRTFKNAISFWIGDNLEIENLFLVKKFENDHNYVTGGGVLKYSHYFTKKKTNVYFGFTYNTTSNRINIYNIYNLKYHTYLAEALAHTIPIKEAFFAVNSKNEKLFLDLGEEITYDVDKEFVEKINETLQHTRSGIVINNGKEVKFTNSKDEEYILELNDPSIIGKIIKLVNYPKDLLIQLFKKILALFVSQAKKTKYFYKVKDKIELKNRILWKEKKILKEANKNLVNKELLLSYKIRNLNEKEINKQDNFGDTLLIKAIKKGKTKKVKFLLQNKHIDIEKTDCSGNTAWIWAAWEGNMEIIQLLLNQKNIKNINVNKKDNEGYSALHAALFNNHIEIVKLLLSHKEIKINDTDENGNTILILAIKDNLINIVKILLERKDLNINQKNKEGYTAFDIASQEGSSEIQKLLDNFKKV